MPSFNKVILMGNLTRDPELRVTVSGFSICKMSLAVNRVYQTREGERREEVTYVDIDAFGRQAETISKYMTKGEAHSDRGPAQAGYLGNPAGGKAQQARRGDGDFQVCREPRG